MSTRQYRRWQKRKLDGDEWHYIWADRIERDVGHEEPLLIHVIIGVNAHGGKSLLAFSSGENEDVETWHSLLLDLRERGMKPPRLATADGRSGFKKALAKVFQDTRFQCCWTHIWNSLRHHLPMSLHQSVRELRHALFYCRTRADALAAIKTFKSSQLDGYPRARASLQCNRRGLCRFYEYPIPFWQLLHSTDLIHTTLKTVRLRFLRKPRRANPIALAMLWRQAREIENSWSRLTPLCGWGDYFEDRTKTLYDLNCWAETLFDVVGDLPECLKDEARDKLEKVWHAGSPEDIRLTETIFSSAFRNRYPKVMKHLCAYLQRNKTARPSDDTGCRSHEISGDALEILGMYNQRTTEQYPSRGKYRQNVRTLYHFTNIGNLPGIRRLKGLCSKLTLKNAGCWPVPKSGGNDESIYRDWKNQNWGKVALSFTPHTPMAYYKKATHHQGEDRDRICFFVVRFEIILLKDVEFSNTNSAASARVQRPGTAGLDEINFRAIRDQRENLYRKREWRHDVQAEVLVPDRVCLGFVREIAFASKADLALGVREWGERESDTPTFKVVPCLFTNGPYYCNSDCLTYHYRGSCP